MQEKWTLRELQNSFLLLTVVLMTLLILRLLSIYISKIDLFFDEAQYWAWSLNLDFGYFSKPPFLAWSIRNCN